jgi:hypothetical protein
MNHPPLTACVFWLLIEDRAGFLLGVQGGRNAGRRVCLLLGSTEAEFSGVRVLQTMSGNSSWVSAREAPPSLCLQLTFETLKRQFFGGIKTIQVEAQSLRLAKAL